MQVCDLCQRTEKQAKCEQMFIHFDGETQWNGHLCRSCSKRVADSLRTLVPSPSPDAAPFATPTPKQAYVLGAAHTWVDGVFLLFILLLAAVFGMCVTMAWVTYLQH